MASPRFLRRLTRNWEQTALGLVLILMVAGMLYLVPYLRLTQSVADQYWTNIVGGLVAGVITSLILGYYFQRQEQREELAKNREVFVEIKNLLVEYDKDLLEKLKVDITPPAGLKTFRERESDIREKVESLLADLAGEPEELRKQLSVLSYFEYREFAHRLATYGRLNDQFSPKLPPDVRQLLAELELAVNRVEDHFQTHSSKWVSGTEFVNGKEMPVVTGKKSEKENMADVVNEEASEIQRALRRIAELKERVDELLES